MKLTKYVYMFWLLVALVTQQLTCVMCFFAAQAPHSPLRYSPWSPDPSDTYLSRLKMLHTCLLHASMHTVLHAWHVRLT